MLDSAISSRSLLKNAISRRNPLALTTFCRDSGRDSVSHRRSWRRAKASHGAFLRLLRALCPEFRDAEQIVGGASEHEQPIHFLQPA